MNIEQTISGAHELLAKEERDPEIRDNADHKKLYFELKEKFKNLLKYLDGLKHFTEK